MAGHRLTFQSSGSTQGERQRVLSKLEAGGNDLPIVRMVANWEPGFRPFVLMADALLVKGQLRPTTREVAVLRMAAIQGLEYEWEEHVSISARAGVTDDQREALRTMDGAKAIDGAVGGTAEAAIDGLFDPEQLTALAVVETVLANGALPAPAWDSACEQLGEAGALELIFAIAWWAGFVPIVARTLLPLTDEAE